MADITFRGTPVRTVGDLPAVGSVAPPVTVTGADMVDLGLDEFEGRRVVLNVFPSIDTGVCAMSVRRFNQIASSLDNTTVLCVSADLPYALKRFCGAEGLDDVVVGSTFRSTFGDDYGVRQADGPQAGLNARSVVVLDADRTVLHAELVPETAQEPDYDAAVRALR